VFRNIKGVELGDEPYEQRGDGGGENETRNPADCGFRQRFEGRLPVPLSTEADGLQGAHVARDHAEDGHADAALDEHADKRPL